MVDSKKQDDDCDDTDNHEEFERHGQSYNETRYAKRRTVRQVLLTISCVKPMPQVIIRFLADGHLFDRGQAACAV